MVGDAERGSPTLCWSLKGIENKQLDPVNTLAIEGWRRADGEKTLSSLFIDGPIQAGRGGQPHVCAARSPLLLEPFAD